MLIHTAHKPMHPMSPWKKHIYIYTQIWQYFSRMLLMDTWIPSNQSPGVTNLYPSPPIHSFLFCCWEWNTQSVLIPAHLIEKESTYINIIVLMHQKYFSWTLITHEHLNTNQPINPLQRSWLQSWDGPMMDVEALSSSKNVAHLQMEPSGWAMIGKYTNSLIANRQTTSCLINHRGDGLMQSVICDSPIHGISAPTSF